MKNKTIRCKNCHKPIFISPTKTWYHKRADNIQCAIRLNAKPETKISLKDSTFENLYKKIVNLKASDINRQNAIKYIKMSTHIYKILKEYVNTK